MDRPCFHASAMLVVLRPSVLSVWCRSLSAAEVWAWSSSSDMPNSFSSAAATLMRSAISCRTSGACELPSWFFSASISSRRELTRVPSSSSFTAGFVRIFFAEEAKRIVDSVIVYDDITGDAFASIAVRQLPMSESESKYVSLLFLYGMCAIDAAEDVDSCDRERLEIMRLSAQRLLLMFLLSFWRTSDSPAFA